MLGPLVYSLHKNIICHHSLHFHCYADDVQLHSNSLPPDQLPCWNEIMEANFLKQNCDRSRWLWLFPDPSPMLLPTSLSLAFKFFQYTTYLTQTPSLHSQKPSIRPPPNLTNLLHHHTLHSSDANPLSPPSRAKHQTWSGRAFSVTAPSLWISLPKHTCDGTSVRIFKKLLKTHLLRT